MIKKFLKQVYLFIKAHIFYFWLMLFLLVGGIVMGLFVPEDVKAAILNLLMQKFKSMGDISVFDIFLNNLVVALILVFGGMTLFLPYLVVLINGLMIGAMVPMMLSKMGGVGLAGGLVPHGIFELSAFILAGSLGAMLAARLLGKLKKMNWGELWIRVSQVFVLVVVPLLAVAAVMEVYVSPKVAMALSGGRLASVQTQTSNSFSPRYYLSYAGEQSTNVQTKMSKELPRLLDENGFVAETNQRKMKNPLVKRFFENGMSKDFKLYLKQDRKQDFLFVWEFSDIERSASADLKQARLFVDNLKNNGMGEYQASILDQNGEIVLLFGSPEMLKELLADSHVRQIKKSTKTLLHK